jgi:SAM-dependent methyltransferase
LKTEAVACWGMIVAFISKKTGQFTYFSLQLGDSDWSRKNVLDFGGNIGNMLRDPNSTIDERRYWCLDVNSEAIDAGRASHPNAHWHFYNRNCFFFNPTGVPHLKLPLLQERFDYIVAYSVFTNSSRADMIDLVAQLRRLLKADGRLAFTFIDPYFHSWPGSYHGNNFRWRLERIKNDNSRVDIDALAKAAGNATWFVLVNEDDLYVENEEIKHYAPEQQRSHYVFYTEEYLRSLLPEATFLPPVNREMQHCCVLKASQDS